MQCKPEQLIPWSDQPRKHFPQSKHLELVDSLTRNGQLQNLIVRPIGDKFQVIVGERRRRALAAIHKDAECTVRDLDDDAAQQVALVENLERADLHPLEEADALSGLGSSAEQIASRISGATVWVRARLGLIRLVDAARAAFLDEEHALDLDRALLICRLGPKDQKAMLVHCGEPMARFKMLVRACRRVLGNGCFQTMLADDTMPGNACGTCHKRSNAQPTLFDDPALQKDDLCLDGECWRNNELEACERFRRDSPQPCHLISTAAEPDHPDALTRGDWKEKDQNPDARGIPIDGNQIGELLGIQLHVEDAVPEPLPEELLRAIENLSVVHPTTQSQLLATLLGQLDPQGQAHVRETYDMEKPKALLPVLASMAAHLCPLVNTDGSYTKIAQAIIADACPSASAPALDREAMPPGAMYKGKVVVAMVPGGLNPKQDYNKLYIQNALPVQPKDMREWKKLRSEAVRKEDSYLVVDDEGRVRWPR